jgi:hypothetical protein
MHGFIKVEIALQSEEILPRKKGKEERAKKKKKKDGILYVGYAKESEMMWVLIS